jgi:hypothetical protein
MMPDNKTVDITNDIKKAKSEKDIKKIVVKELKSSQTKKV